MTIMFNEGTNMHSSGARTVSDVSLNENEAYTNKAIETITVNDIDGSTRLTPTLDATSRALGFAYNATTGAITYTGTFDFEALTDGDTNTAGKQHIITLTATGSDGVAATHQVVVTLTNVDEKPAPAVPLPKTPVTVIKGEEWSYTIPDFVDPEDVDIASYAATIPSGIRSWLKFNATTRTFSIAAGATDRITTGEHEITVTATAGTGGSAQASDPVKFKIALSDLFSEEPSAPLPPVSIATITRDIGGSSPKTGVDIFHIRTIQRGPDGEGVTVSFVNDTGLTGAFSLAVMGRAVVISYKASDSNATVGKLLEAVAADARVSGLVAFNKGAGVDDTLALRDITGLETTGYESGGASESTEFYEFTPAVAATLTANGLIFTAEVPGTGANGIVIEYETPQGIPAGDVDIQYQQGVLTIRYNSSSKPTLQAIIDGIAMDEANTVLTAKLATSGTGGDELDTTGTLGGALGTTLLAANGLYFTAKTPGMDWVGAKIVYETTSSVASGEVMVKGFDDANNIVTLQINNTVANYPTLAAIIAAIEGHSVSDVLAVKLQDFGAGDSKLEGSTLGGTFAIVGTAVTPGIDATLQSSGPRNVPTTFDPGPDAVHLAVQNMETAQATITGNTQDILTVTAAQPGALGNDIRITLIEDNTLDDGVVDFYIDGRAITAVYAPGVDTASKTTVGEFIAAAEANAEVSSLVTFARAGAAIFDITPMLGTATNNLRGAGIVAGEHASVTVGGLVFTAKNPGVVGNALRVVTADSRYSTSPGAVTVPLLDPLPADGLLGIRYDDGLLTISLPSNPNHYPTLDNIIAKVTNSSSSDGADVFFDVAVAEGVDGATTRLTPFGYTSLSGGVNAAVQLSGGGLPPAEATKASLTYNGLIFTAKEAGEDGNDIVITGYVSSRVNDNQVAVSFDDTTNRLSLGINSDREKYPTLQTIITAIEGNTKADAAVSVELLVDGTGEEKLARSFFQPNDDSGHRLSGGGDAPSDSDAFADPRVPLGNIGTAGGNTLTALNAGNREVVVDGQGGNDTITLGDSTEEVVYRITDGMDTVNKFTIGTDRLTLIAPPGANGVLEIPHPDGKVAFTISTDDKTDAFNGLTISLVVDNGLPTKTAKFAYTQPSGDEKGSLVWTFNAATGTPYGNIDPLIRHSQDFDHSPGKGSSAPVQPSNSINIGGDAMLYSRIDTLLGDAVRGRVALVYDATNSNYTGMVLEYSKGITARITFTTALTEAKLITALGSSITNANTLATIFANKFPTTNGEAALSTAGQALISTLFGENLILRIDGGDVDTDHMNLFHVWNDATARALVYDATAETYTGITLTLSGSRKATITLPTALDVAGLKTALRVNDAQLMGIFTGGSLPTTDGEATLDSTSGHVGRVPDLFRNKKVSTIDFMGTPITYDSLDDLLTHADLSGSAIVYSTERGGRYTGVTLTYSGGSKATITLPLANLRFDLVGLDRGGLINALGDTITNNNELLTIFTGQVPTTDGEATLSTAGKELVGTLLGAEDDYSITIVGGAILYDSIDHLLKDNTLTLSAASLVYDAAEMIYTGIVLGFANQANATIADVRIDFAVVLDQAALIEALGSTITDATTLATIFAPKGSASTGAVPTADGEAALSAAGRALVGTLLGTDDPMRRDELIITIEGGAPQYDTIDALLSHRNFGEASLVYNATTSKYTGIVLEFSSGNVLRINFATALDQAALIEALGPTITDSTTLATIFDGGTVPTTSKNAALSDAGKALVDTLLGGDDFIMISGTPPEYELDPEDLALIYRTDGELNESTSNLETYGYLYPSAGITNPTITHNGANARYGRFSYDEGANRWAYTLIHGDPQTAALTTDATETITFTIVDAVGVERTHDLEIDIDVSGTAAWLKVDETQFRETSPDAVSFVEIHGVRFSLVGDIEEGDPTGIQIRKNGMRTYVRNVGSVPATRLSINGSQYDVIFDGDKDHITPQEIIDLWNDYGADSAISSLQNERLERVAAIKAEIASNFDPGAVIPEEITTTDSARFPGHVPLQASVEVHNVRFTITEQGTTGGGRKLKFEVKTGTNEQGVFFDSNTTFTVIFDPADPEYANITPRELVRFVNAVAEPNANITIRASLVNKGESSPGTAATPLTPAELAATGDEGTHTFAVPDSRPDAAEIRTGSVTLNHHSPNEETLNQHILRTNGRLTITDTDGIATDGNGIPRVTHDGANAKYGTFSFDVATGLWAYELKTADSDLATQDEGTIQETITFTVVDETTPNPVTKTHELMIDINIIGTPKGLLSDDTVFQERESDGSEHFTFSPLAFIHGVLFEYDTIAGAAPEDFHFVIEAHATPQVIEGSGGGHFTLRVDEADADFTPEALATLWNESANGTGADGMAQTAATRTGRISAEVLDNTLTGVNLTDANARAAFAGNYVFAPRPHNMVMIDLEDSTKTTPGLTTGGLLTISDIDGISTVTMKSGSGNPAVTVPTTDTVVSLGATNGTRYGTFTFNRADSAWSYVVNSTHPDITDTTHRNFLIETITFTVTDKGGSIEMYDLRIGIDIDAKGIPVAPSGFDTALTAMEGVAKDIILPAFEHIDGDDLTYAIALADDNGAASADPLPGWLMFNADTRTLSVTDATDDADVKVHNLVLTVTDSGTGPEQDMVRQAITLTIQNVNEAPASADTTIMTDDNPPVVLTATEGQAPVVIPITAFPFTDPDADTTPDGQLGGVRIVTIPEHGQFFLTTQQGGSSSTAAVAKGDIIPAGGRLTFQVLPTAPVGPAEKTFKFKVLDAGTPALESDDEYTATIKIMGIDSDVVLNVNPATIPFTIGTAVTLTTSHLSISDPDTQNIDTTAAVFTLAAIDGGRILVNGTAIAVGGTFTQKQIEDGLVTFEGTKPGNFMVTGVFGTGPNAKTFDVPQMISFTTDSTVIESDRTGTRLRVTLDYRDSNRDASDNVISGTLTITDTNGITPINVTHDGDEAEYGVFMLMQNAINGNEYDWTYTLDPNRPAVIGLTGSNNPDPIKITVTDDAGNEREFDLNIRVRIQGAPPAPPTFTSGPTMDLAEDHDLSMPVYTAEAEDVNNDTITYSLKAGVGDEALFTIDSDSGEVRYKTTAPALDFETPPSRYTFTVVADDGTGETPAEHTVILTLTDADDPATLIGLQNAVAQLSASQSTTFLTKLADIYGVIDVDGGSPGMFEVVATNADHAALFSITGTELFLAAGADIRDLAGETITVTIQQTGNPTPPVTALYSLNIVADTDAPTEFTPGSEGSGPHNVTFDHDDPADPTTAEFTGTLTIADTDGVDTVTASDATYGRFTLTAPSSGDAYSWTYTFDSEDPDSLTLGTDITVTETITIRVIDDKGFQALETLTFNIDISGTLPPRKPTANPPLLFVDEEAPHTFEEANFGYADANDDDLASITIISLPDAAAGVLKLNGVAVSAGGVITADQLNRENPDSLDPPPTGLVFEPVGDRATTIQTSFTYTVNDGTADSAQATMDITVNADNDPPVLDVRKTIGVEITAEPHIFGARQFGFTDTDSPVGDVSAASFTLTAITGGVVERYDTTANEWVPVPVGTGTFSHEQVADGHVRLNAFGPGSMTVTGALGSTTFDEQTITFTAQVEADVDGTDLGGAGGQKGEVDLSGQTTPRTITTGLGDTKIKPGGGDDKIDPGLGDDEVDLTAGGDDVVIYRFERDTAGNIVGWDGGDTISGFTPGEDRLVLLDIGAGGTGGTNTPFIDNLGMGFIATLATAYTGSGDRTSLNNYNIEGVELHFAEAVLLPGGVLGGSVVTILFDAPIAWDDFNTIWLNGNAQNAAFWPNILQFRDSDAGKAALRGILGLNEVEADRDSIPSGAGTRRDDTLSTVGAVGQASVYGREGDDTITLGRAAEEVIYRVAESGGAATNVDGSDIVNGFTLGVDRLTFVEEGGGLADLDALLSGISSVALAFRDGNYTAIVFTIVAETSAGAGDAITLRINFASSLNASELMTHMGLDATQFDAFFSDGSAPVITGTTEATAAIASGAGGHGNLPDLFGGDTHLTFTDSVPEFKAARLPSSATRSIAVGGDEADTIDLNAESGHWVIFGGAGDDTITLAPPPQTPTQQVDEIVYRLGYTAGTGGNPGTTTTPDGTDTVNNFALGEDKLTFIAGDPVRGEVVINSTLTIRTKAETDAFNGLEVTIAVDNALTTDAPVAIAYTAPAGGNAGSLAITIDDAGATYADILAAYAADAAADTPTFAADLDFIVAASARDSAATATPATAPTIVGGALPLALADVLGAFAEVSLIQGSQASYTGIAFEITDGGPTLTLNFISGGQSGTDLRNTDLMQLLGLADADAAVGALFAGTDAGTTLTAAPNGAGTYALSEAGIGHIADLFRIDNIEVDDALPAELL